MASSSTPEHQQLAQAVNDGTSAINAASTTEELRTVVGALTGKKGAISTIKSSLGKVSDVEMRKELGQLVNEALTALQAIADSRSRQLRAGEFASVIESDRVDITEVAMSA